MSVDGSKFALVATATGLASVGSNSKENQIAVVGTQINKDTLRRMEKPESRFLRPICDYVIFDNSPMNEARFAA